MWRTNQRGAARDTSIFPEAFINPGQTRGCSLGVGDTHSHSPAAPTWDSWGGWEHLGAEPRLLGSQRVCSDTDTAGLWCFQHCRDMVIQGPEKQSQPHLQNIRREKLAIYVKNNSLCPLWTYFRNYRLVYYLKINYTNRKKNI